MKVKLIITINQPDSASIRTGISPVTSDPANKYDICMPANALTAMMPLSEAIASITETVIIPFHCTGTSGISTIDERTINIIAYIKAIR